MEYAYHQENVNSSAPFLINVQNNKGTLTHLEY